MSEAIVTTDWDDSLGLDGGGQGVRAVSDPKLTENGERVLRARYLKKDESGACTESPRDLYRRVAKAIADAELLYGNDPEVRSEWEARFYRLMADGRFMPNSPTFMNAGREMGMLSACFVLPVGDSVSEIFDSIKHTALIQKAGGGTGFAFDELRPTGDYISSSGGTTSGPISFWRAFSEATNAIQQGAFRRGANMGMMYIHHPDILKFLHAKEDLTQFTNYNISVKVTDEWMESFLGEPDGAHVVVNPRTKRRYLLPSDLKVWEYDIRSLTELGTDGEVPPGDYYSRRDVWEIIINNAHRTGEPGVVFIDRINRDNPTPHIGRIEATNPCGEQPLLPYEACNLGSISLAEFVHTNDRGLSTVDWDGLRETIHQASRFLDNVIDVNRYPLPEIDTVCKANRKIGLGIMGFADSLFKLGVAYDSKEGIAWGERFMKFVNDEAHNYSERLAGERGCFPNWKGSIHDTQFDRPMRNATCTTVAPTGTISIIAGCSGGIEPLYSLAFFRNVLRGKDERGSPMAEVNPIFETVAKRRGLLSEGLMERLATDGTLANVPGIPDELREVFVCAHDIAPVWHVRMQAVFQKHCDASISKTINFPKGAVTDDIDQIYRLAHQLGCKGVTVYRDGSRECQPMALQGNKEASADNGQKKQPGEDQMPTELVPAVLPEITSGIRVRQLTPFGNMHINITVDPKSERELEVFAQLGKGGDLANSDLEAICRMVSLWLRSGGSIMHVIRQMRGIGSSLQLNTKDGKIMSLGDGLARALTKYTRAKDQFGLKALILGDYDAAALDKAVVSGKNGNNGRGNGHTKPGSTRSGNAEQTVTASLSKVEPGGMQWQKTQFKVVCPECQMALRFNEGCETCDSCGYARC